MGLCFGIAYGVSGEGIRGESDLHALRSPLIIAVKLEGKLDKWPDNAKAPCILISSELCAESSTLEYFLYLL